MLLVCIKVGVIKKTEKLIGLSLRVSDNPALTFPMLTIFGMEEANKFKFLGKS